MSWQRRIMITLAGAATLQLCILGGFYLANRSASPSIASFDAERALNLFVTWSENRLTDEEFKSLLGEFEHQVELELATLATAHGLLILSSQAVLAYPQGEIPDVTEAVMAEVLQ